MDRFPDSLDDLADAGLRGQSRLFRLKSRFRYHSRNHGTIVVPSGFITDGASIPSLFWPIFAPYGSALRPAIVHDFLYRRQSLTYYAHLDRAAADRIFLEAMTDCGMWPLERRAIYRAVRLFGWRSYRKT